MARLDPRRTGAGGLGVRLVDTAYGRLLLAKITLFLGLIALGAYNQRRSMPRLRALAAGDQHLDRAPTLLRRAVMVEVASLRACSR